MGVCRPGVASTPAGATPAPLVGFTNTASQIASFVSSIAFGYLGGDSGNYNLPFIPMVVTSSIGAVLWLKIDPAHQVFDETPTTREVPMAAARA